MIIWSDEQTSRLYDCGEYSQKACFLTMQHCLRQSVVLEKGSRWVMLIRSGRQEKAQKLTDREH